MRSVKSSSLEWEEITSPRESGVRFKRLLHGEPGALDNYEFTLVEVQDKYDTPQHAHNFDQVRILLEGEFGFGSRVQKEGSIGYFPAGTEYQQCARGPSLTLLLQVGAACRQGFLHFGQIQEAVRTLKTEGSFKDGKFHYGDGRNEEPVVDGYEAVFLKGAGFRSKIPPPRFEDPVIVNPEAIEPLLVPHGGKTRFVGTFNEYGLTISQRQAEAGETLTLTGPEGQKSLLFVLDGSITDRHGTHWEEGDAIEIESAEELVVEAAVDLKLIQIDLPDFDRGT